MQQLNHLTIAPGSEKLSGQLKAFRGWLDLWEVNL